MSVITLHYDVPGDDFTRAGEASGDVKAHLKKLGFSPEVIRNTVIALYEGEINMVIHAGGGRIDVDIDPDVISMVLSDDGPGIPDVAHGNEGGIFHGSRQCACSRLRCRNGASQYKKVY